MSELADAIRAADVARNAQLDRIVAAGVARPHLDLNVLARAVEVFGWPSDAARGCLFGLVGAAWGSGFIVDLDSTGDVNVWDGEGYGCPVRPGFDGEVAAPEDENLIAALEAAPTEAP